MSNGHSRRKAASDIRREAADLAFNRLHPEQSSNSDENRFPNYIGNFTKGLPHSSTTGEVDPPAYQALLEALRASPDDDFQTVPLPTGVTKLRKLVNPRAGLAFDLEGPDSAAVAMPPAPAVDSAQAAGEAVELYWMALLRDVPFVDYATDSLAISAVADLNNLSDFPGPKTGGQVTAQTLFRGASPGELVGPYVSQFLLLDIPYGSLTISQRQTTAQANADYMTSWGAWLAVQNGEDTSGTDQFDMTMPRYIRNGRDLSTYVHFDALYEAYLNACLILLGAKAPFDVGMPYRSSQRQEGFGTFGGPHILSLVTEVATRALKAVWRQKWHVHRRLRPEAYGGLVHRVMMDNASYPVHADVLNSQALVEVENKFSSYLLPMAFPEGSPIHPAYGAGHATVAGACTTVLKAWFDESFPIADLTLPTKPGQLGPKLGNPKVPDAIGASLIDYTGADKDQLTVGGELNKVAANIAIGRNHAGVHWYTDYSESFALGEEIAIGILEEQALTYREGGSFTLTRFDGTQVVI